jgi:hypothetical protein
MSGGTKRLRISSPWLEKSAGAASVIPVVTAVGVRSRPSAAIVTML